MPNHNSADGFTLTEILIAVFILAIGLVGVLSLFPVGIHATGKVIQASNAGAVARTAFATMQDMNFIQSVAGQGFATYELSGGIACPLRDLDRLDAVIDVYGLDQYSWTLEALPTDDTRIRAFHVQAAVFRNRSVFNNGGTAAFSNSNSLVVGTGTLWTTGTAPLPKPGGYIRHIATVDVNGTPLDLTDDVSVGIWYRIREVLSDTQIRLEQAFQYPDLTGAYELTNSIVSTVETLGVAR